MFVIFYEKNRRNTYVWIAVQASATAQTCRAASMFDFILSIIILWESLIRFVSILLPMICKEEFAAKIVFLNDACSAMENGCNELLSS